MTDEKPDAGVIKFVDPAGNVIDDKKLIKLSSELETLTLYFTQKVKEAADRHGVKLITHVQFEGVTPQNNITEDN